MANDTVKTTVKKTKNGKKKSHKTTEVVPEVKEVASTLVVEAVPETVSTPTVDTKATTTTTSTVDTTATTDSPDPEMDTDVSQDFKDVLDELSKQSAANKTLTARVKKLEKRVAREFKEAQKKGKKKGGSKNVDKPKRAPSGFAKPAPISEDLRKFLGKETGIEMARTEVTKYITQYIKDHELQNPANKRHILPDDKLTALLNVQKDDEVTYFNLQKFMKHHFPKPVHTTSVSS